MSAHPAGRRAHPANLDELRMEEAGPDRTLRGEAVILEDEIMSVEAEKRGKSRTTAEWAKGAGVWGADQLDGLDKRLEGLGVQLVEISAAVQGTADGVSAGDDNEDRKRLKEKLSKALQSARLRACEFVDYTFTCGCWRALAYLVLLFFHPVLILHADRMRSLGDKVTLWAKGLEYVFGICEPDRGSGRSGNR